MRNHLRARATALTPHLLALALYLGVAVVLSWPMVCTFGSATVGMLTYSGIGDALQNVWNIWWLRHALSAGQNPYWVNLLFYPDGVQFYLQTLSLTNIVPVIPVARLAGVPAAYNTAVLLAMALTGYTTFLLARFFTPSLGIALLCGLLITASPLHMIKLQANQLNLLSLQWLPLYLLALLYLEHAPSRRTIAATVLMALLILFADWYWFLICVVCTPVWAAATLLRAAQPGRLIRAYLAVAVGVGMGALPLIIGILQVRDQLPVGNGIDQIWADYVRGFSADLLSLFAPNLLNRWWGIWVREHLVPITPAYAVDGWYVAGGWVLLACASLGLRQLWRVQRPLVLLAAFAWVLSLGPSLRVAGRDTGFPLPYAWLAHIPLLSVGRRPAPFMLLVMLVASIAAAMGLQQALAQSSWQRRSLILGLLTVLAAIELAPPSAAQRQMISLDPPLLMRELHARPGPVADLPFTWTEDSRSLLNQMGHEQPIIGGYVARWPSYPSVRRIPLLQHLAELRHKADIIPMDASALRAMQCAYPVRHVLLSQDAVSRGQQAVVETLATTLAGAPVIPRQADGYLWYELPLVPAPCLPFISLGTGWDAVEHDALARWRWMGAEATLVINNTQPVAQMVKLGLSLTAFKTARSITLLDGDRALGSWLVAPGPAHRHEIWLQLAPGRTELTLHAPADADPSAPRLISVSAQEIQLTPLAMASAEASGR
ncbi:MAG: hypothetical protein WCJ55_04980 [Chloroflexales bacterium]